MQILTREGNYEQRAISGTIPWGSTAPVSNGQLGGGFAGGHIDERTALQIAAVWGSVDLISTAIATLPLQQWRQVSQTEAVKIPSSPVIERPWSEITMRDFIVQGTLSMLLRGNLWGQVVSRDGFMLPSQVRLVHPDHAHVRRLPSGELEFRYWNKVQRVDDVTRAMALSFPEGIEGLSPIGHLRSAFGIARAQDLYGNAFYANSARPDGVIELDDDLDSDETRAMMSAWDEAHNGINRSHRPAILTGGAKWKPVTMNLRDAQFLEQMQYSASVISGMIFRIPEHKLGMQDRTSSWGSGIEQMELGFVADTLLIWLCRWEDLFRTWLPARQFVTFDLSQRLRGDTLQRMSGYQIARVIGAMNGAEVRAAEGWPKVTEPKAAALLEAYDTPFTSSPVKAASSSVVGPGGDKAN